MPEYSLNPLQDDCYENSTVLKNKFNIHDDEKLILWNVASRVCS